jgi:transposase
LPTSHGSKGQSRAKPTLGAFTKVIDAWLEEDFQRPRKQRHTAKRVYDRLVAEHGYSGHSSTIRRYVSQVKRRLAGQEVFVPLQFDAGEEAQVDWGESSIIENGTQRKVQLFCMKLAYSGHSFVRAYERANLESFLDGHVRAFEFFGGISKRLAYDNRKSAVIQVGRGKERRLNERFRELRSWYLFETRFCNVARGNEKGHVENLVKWSQRNLLTPLPEVPGVTALNELLAVARQPYEDDAKWREEQSKLR